MEIKKSYEKTTRHNITKANAKEDIGLINRYTLRDLKPEDVFCFDLILCDNEIDRDLERFSIGTLEQLARLFIGKTGIVDHDWKAENQLARVYAAKAEQVVGQRNRLGEPLHRLRASAYMLRNDDTRPMIASIEGGIVKEVSVGVAVKHCNCSICGRPLIGKECENGHVKGERSAGGLLCVGSLEDATDAYEFSFVAVPAQRGTGVTKTAKKPVKSVATPSEEAINTTAGPLIPRSEHSPVSRRYAMITTKDITDADLKSAWTAAGFARKEMGLPPVKILWFMPEAEAVAKGCKTDGVFEHGPLTMGLFDPKVSKSAIFVRYGVGQNEIQKTVIHELCHLAHNRVGFYGSEGEEDETDLYTHKAIMSLWSHTKDQLEQFCFDEICGKDWSGS